MQRYSIIGLFARQLGLHTFRGLLTSEKYDLLAVFTHYYETDDTTVRPLFQDFVDLAEEHGVPLIVIDRNQDKLAIMQDLKPDFVILNCYKWILPERHLSYAKIATLNMHRSLLPKYPGLKPLDKALDAGEHETGTTVHIVTPEVDQGEIIDQWKVPIHKGDTANDLFERLYPTQYPLIARSLEKLTQ